MEQKFKHRLQTKDIIVKQDDANSTTFETNAGFFYPIVMINNIVIDYSDIISFSLEIGNEILPKITLSISDSTYKFREEDFADSTIMTMRIANNIDTNYKPIKNDYRVVNIHSVQNARIITFDAVLNVPKFYNYFQRVFGGRSSLEVFEDIAKECDLGFITNLSQTDDKMNWIQNTNNIEFIKEIIPHSFINNADSLKVFIDQFANLCVMSIQNSFNDTNKHELLSNPFTGETLSTPIDLKLTNYSYPNENERIFGKIKSWSPITNFGLQNLKTPKEYNEQIKSDFIFNNFEKEITKTASTKSDFGVYNMFGIHNDNTHLRYFTAPYTNERNKDILQQGTKILCNTEYYIPIIFVGQKLPLEIYNTIRPKEIETQDKTPLSETEIQKSNEYLKNEQYSKDIIISQITYEYNKNNTLTSSLVCNQKTN